MTVRQTPLKEARCRELRRLFAAQADKAHAAFHKAYHKSARDFYGLRSAQVKGMVKEVFPLRPKLTREEALPLIAELWASNYFEEQSAALLLLERIAGQLSTADLPLLKSMADGCEGWGMLDTLAIGALGPLALQHGKPVYDSVRDWTRDPHMWTRRAALLVHIIPARKRALSAEHAWDSLLELAHEKDFFIRKAIGWTLREISKHYPQEVAAFITEHRGKLAGLSLREGARNLPEELRLPLHGK